MKKEKLLVTALLISVITFSIMLGLSSCRKNNLKGYRINNLAGVELTINADKTYIIQTTESIFFLSSIEPTFYLPDPDLKILSQEIGTSPTRTFNIYSYLHYFEVKVSGLADSVKIIINGTFFDEPVPFYYGTDNIPDSYNVISTQNKIEHVFTSIYLNGICIDIAEGICNLKGDL